LANIKAANEAIANRIQLSHTMSKLKDAFINDDIASFRELDRFGPTEIMDLGENLLILYSCMPCFFN
jgi:hypothetical protein